MCLNVRDGAPFDLKKICTMSTKESKEQGSLYAEMKRLQTKLEFLDITESYVKDEMVSQRASPTARAVA